MSVTTSPSLSSSFHADAGDSADNYDALQPFGRDDQESIHTANSRPIRGANKPKIPFDQAVNKIIKHAEGLRDDRSPLSTARIVGDRLITNDAEYHIDAEANRRIARHFRAQPEYFERLEFERPKLRNALLTHHLQSLGKAIKGRRDRMLHVVHREGELVNLARADLHTLTPQEVIHAVRDGFGSDASSFEVQNLAIHDEAFALEIVSTAVATTVRLGDTIQAGLRIEHSYTGDLSTSVVAFILRLACENGNTYRECLGSRKTPRTRRLNADKEDAGIQQAEQIRRLTAGVRKSLEAQLVAIKKLSEQRASFDELKQFLRQARVPVGVVRQLKESWAVEGNEETAFGLFNALTHLATHGTTISPRQRGMLARLAGIYANRSTHICPKCFSVID